MSAGGGETARGAAARRLLAPAGPRAFVDRWQVVAVATLLAALGGCAAVEGQGRGAVPAEAPAAAPRVLVESTSSAEHKRMVALFGGEYKDAAAEHYLNGVLARFTDVADDENRAYRITILNSPIVNAFALPSGDLFVTRGLLALANDGSEVAAVMAHEIAHVTKRHALARAEQEKRAAVISKAAMVIQNRQRGEEMEATAKLSIAGFSRQQELEADETGIKTVARAGYDPYGASRFLASLGRSSALRASLIGQNASSSKPDILATHPSTPERVAQAVKVARAIAGPDIGTSDREAYLSAIDLIMFGDDPADGTIRGRKFTQPRLGFSFMAPDGFVLENSTQAVLGVKEGGVEALRLDSVAVPTATSLDSYLASGWIDGLMASSTQSIDVNGMPGVTATARAGEWNFRVAVIRFSPTEVYRLIFAAHMLDAAQEKQYRAAIDSFRKIDPDEAGKVRPLRIGLLTAKAGDTAASMSTRMVVPDKPLETFELLNGLMGAGPLKLGQKYKLVIE